MVGGGILVCNVDFIRTYADRTHHGKEEDILFRDLAEVEMSEEDGRVMQELVDEHVHARRLVGELVEANERYRQGETGTLATILEKLDALVELYPGHIEKEDACLQGLHGHGAAAGDQG